MQSVLLFTGFIVSLTVVLCERDFSDPFDDWKTDHYKVYDSSESANLKEKDTLKLLKGLQTLYTGRTDYGSTERMYRVTELIQYNEIKPENCDTDYFVELDRQIKRHNKYTNCVNYLLSQRRRQIALCETMLPTASKISADLVVLNRCLSNGAKVKYYNSRRRNVVGAGVLCFIEAKNGGKLNHASMMMNGKDEHEELVALMKPLIEEACQSIADETLSLYLNKVVTNEIAQRLVSYHNNCDYLLPRLDEVAKEVKIGLNYVAPGLGGKVSRMAERVKLMV